MLQATPFFVWMRAFSPRWSVFLSGLVANVESIGRQRQGASRAAWELARGHLPEVFSSCSNVLVVVSGELSAPAMPRAYHAALPAESDRGGAQTLRFAELESCQASATRTKSWPRFCLRLEARCPPPRNFAPSRFLKLSKWLAGLLSRGLPVAHQAWVGLDGLDPS